MSQQQPPYQQPVAPPEPKNGFGITVLVLGIIGVIFGFIPFTGFVALILGILAVLFAFLGWGRGRKGRANNRKMNYFGGGLGIVAIALGIWGLVIVFQATEDFVNDMDKLDQQFPQGSAHAAPEASQVPPRRPTIAEIARSSYTLPFTARPGPAHSAPWRALHRSSFPDSRSRLR